MTISLKFKVATKRTQKINFSSIVYQHSLKLDRCNLSFCLSKNSYPCLSGFVSISLITFLCCISCLQTTLLKVTTPYLVMQSPWFSVQEGLAFFFNASPISVLFPCWWSGFSVMVVLEHDFSHSLMKLTCYTRLQLPDNVTEFQISSFVATFNGIPLSRIFNVHNFLFAVQTHRQAGRVDTTHRWIREHTHARRTASKEGNI